MASRSCNGARLASWLTRRLAPAGPAVSARAGASAGAASGRAAAAAAAGQRRGCAAAGGAAGTQGTRLGAYLERCGATWADDAEAQDVQAAEPGRSYVWRVGLPPDRLATLRSGEPLESRPFELGSGGVRARFQLFPKGDAVNSQDGVCSLWLCTDSREQVPVRLRLGGVERRAGASDFARLEDVLVDGGVEVGVSLDADGAESSGAAAAAAPAVQQSLQLTGLQLAEWRLFGVDALFKQGGLVSSPPFRFHHVLLGDMYLELVPGAPHPEHCALFFRCRVPTMRLRVKLEVGGGSFSKSFEAVGKSSWETDLKESRCLQVNLSAPNVLESDGSVVVRAELEEVAAIPAALRDMIPRLDERALWPKRL